MAALNQMIYGVTNQAERNKTRHRQRQTCFECGCSMRRLCFEMVNYRRYCSRCMKRPNCNVIDGLGREVPIWSQVHAMTARVEVDEKWQLQMHGFAEVELQKDDNGVFQIPCWVKLCVMGRQYEQPRERGGRSLIVFQLFEYLEQKEKESWDGKEFKKEKMTLCTGIYALAFIDGPNFFFRPLQ